MRLLLQIVLVALGSAAGGLARWGVGVAAARLLGTKLPYGTFLINITGCLFLGWFMTVLGRRISPEEGAWLQTDDLRLMMAVGFAGAYTTFSTFEWEVNGLWRGGDSLAAIMYIVASVLVGLAALRAGVWLAG